MLPDFESDVLPAGVHPARWDDIAPRLGFNEHRLSLLARVLPALRSLREAGCTSAYLDGSFVTTKLAPGDIDICWPMSGVDLAKLHPVLLDVHPPRDAQHAVFGADILPNIVEVGSGLTLADFFQQDPDRGGVKGIIALDLGSLP